MTTIDDVEESCDICAEPIACECDDPEHCWTCDGAGEYVPDHCCACGGSPYCQCCPTCSADNAGACQCPMTVTLADGTTKAIPPVTPEPDQEHEAPDVHDDEPDPEPPDGYYDEAPEPTGPSEPWSTGGYSSEPPF
ncbi:hypothetical protein IPZ58_07620 [Streptomyces roseoverticillatus]|uniref:hypothetical protein n=1 Tax=Streptomyces roseoverticillatus TaxID=66429 RepID=UPI001F2ECE49|nr:hypothetical protein [Streptomyces roseoverticillatus]MCF3101448.1 hypothetical protein [Streptomyces roseoverticillatus]